MTRKTKSGRLLLVLCSIALTLSFQACRSDPEEIPVPIELPSAPLPPTLVEVRWQDRLEGLWLSPDEYRNLEVNIVRMGAYEDALVAYIELLRSIYGARETAGQNR